MQALALCDAGGLAAVSGGSCERIGDVLTPTGLHPIFDDNRKAIGFWMRDDANQPVRIFVTCEGLWQCDPSQARDSATAFNLFGSRRSRIEEIASDRHAHGAPCDGEHDGLPAMILHGEDIV
jgi:hypothetical protein